MKKAIIGILAVLIVVLLFIVFSAYKSEHGRAIVKLPNGNDLSVYIADNNETRAKGLSIFGSIQDDEGMLFVFPEENTPGFWMKDMKFAIDIIWIDKDLNIVGIEKDIQPETYPEIFSPDNEIKYVLEVNSGVSEINNLKVGDNLELLHY